MISVCIATYNGESFLYRQLRSILDQLGCDDEIIISDDNSNDATVKIIEGFSDDRIKLHKNTNRLGPVMNFERAVALSKGDIIFLADQDDIWLPGKVERMCMELDYVDLVVCDASLIDSAGNILTTSYFKARRSGPGLIKNITRNTYLGCCMAFRRAVFEKAKPFPKDLYHDYWIGIIAEIFFRTRFIDDVLVRYRRHDSNFSSASDLKSNNSFWDILLIRMILFKNLLSRMLTV